MEFKAGAKVIVKKTGEIGILATTVYYQYQKEENWKPPYLYYLVVEINGEYRHFKEEDLELYVEIEAKELDGHKFCLGPLTIRCSADYISNLVRENEALKKENVKLKERNSELISKFTELVLEDCEKIFKI